MLQHDAVRGGEVFPHRIERQPRPPVFQANPGEHAKALRLDKDLAFRVLLGADLLTRVVVSANEPFAVPAVLAHGLFHARAFRDVLLRLFRQAAPLRNRGNLLGRQHEQAGDENRFGYLAFLVGGGLERLARRIGEAVQVETVVPIGAADQRQTMRAKPFERVMETAPQVLIQRLRAARLVVELDRLVENAPVAGLFQVGRDANDQPVRIVVEVAADVVVSLFGQRLVLVIGAARGKLRSRQV